MQTLKLTKKYEHYPEYKDSGVEWVGEIPKSWDTASSRQLFQTKKELALEGESQKVLSLTLHGVVPRILDGSGKNPANYDTYQEFKKDDLVFCLFDYDVTPRTIGHVGENGMMTGAYTRLIPKNEIFSKFYYYYFLSLDYTKELLHLCTGLRNSISKPVFWSMKSPLPTMAEQAKIAAYLDEKTALIDQIIEKKQKLIELLREKRTAVINHAVTNNSGSKTEKIKHLVISISSGVWGDNPLENSDDVACLRVADFDYDNLSFSQVATIRNNPGLKKEKVLRKGDILIEKSGGGEKTPVGRAILFDSDQKMVCANFIDVARVNIKKVLPEFLLLSLASLYSGGVNTKYIKQNTGIQNLDIKEYFEEMISFPEISAQRKIAEGVSAKMKLFEAAIAEVEASIEILQEFKSSLVSHVVMGKVKV